jgi:hypothetical protein
VGFHGKSAKPQLKIFASRRCFGDDGSVKQNHFTAIKEMVLDVPLAYAMNGAGS